MPHDYPDQADEPDSLDALLCDALDAAASDPVRLHLMTALFLLTADDDRAADLDRLRREGPTPTFKL